MVPSNLVENHLRKKTMGRRKQYAKNINPDFPGRHKIQPSVVDVLFGTPAERAKRERATRARERQKRAEAKRREADSRRRAAEARRAAAADAYYYNQHTAGEITADGNIALSRDSFREYTGSGYCALCAGEAGVV